MFHFVHLDLQRAGRRLSPCFANPRDHHDSILRMDTFPNMPSAFSPYDGLAPNTHINSSFEMVRIMVGHKLGLTAYRIGILVEMHQSRGVDTVAVAIFISHEAKVSPFGIFFSGYERLSSFLSKTPIIRHVNGFAFGSRLSSVAVVTYTRSAEWRLGDKRWPIRLTTVYSGKSCAIRESLRQSQEGHEEALVEHSRFTR